MKKNIIHESALTFMLLCSCFLHACAISLVLQPNNMAPGGISGIAVLINSVVPKLSVGMLLLAFNIPLLVAAFFKLGRRFVIYTLLAIVSLSVFTDLLASLANKGLVLCPITSNPVLSAVYGGVLMGVGVGLVMRTGGSTGGTDIIAKLVRLKHREFKFGKIQATFNLVIVAATALVYRNIDSALFTGIAIFVSGTIADLVIYGTDGAMLLFVMSDKSDEISKKFLEIVVGVTFLNGRGAFTGKDKDVLISVVRKPDFTKAQEIIRSTDPDAFVIVSSASEVFGKGFKLSFDD